MSSVKPVQATPASTTAVADPKLANLQARFPSLPPGQVKAILEEHKGHAGKAALALKKLAPDELVDAKADSAVHQKLSASDLRGSDTINTATTQNGELKSIFEEFDTSGDGSLDIDELKQAFAKAGAAMSADEIKIVIEGTDSNSDGKLSYEEFVDAFQRAPKINALVNNSAATVNDELLEIFKSFDASGDGLLEADELKQAFEKAGAPMSDDEILKMINSSDDNSDGRLSFAEFKEAFQKADRTAAVRVLVGEKVSVRRQLSRQASKMVKVKKQKEEQAAEEALKPQVCGNCGGGARVDAFNDCFCQMYDDEDNEGCAPRDAKMYGTLYFTACSPVWLLTGCCFLEAIPGKVVDCKVCKGSGFVILAENGKYKSHRTTPITEEERREEAMDKIPFFLRWF